MSSENVKVVRRLNEAFNARDMDALLACFHADAEAVVLRSKVHGPYQGHDGVRRMVAEAFEADMELRIDTYRDCGDRVLILGHQQLTVRGLVSDHLLAEIFELDGGKVSRLQAFATVEEALEAAGLSG
jgi:hypothetical protein